MTSTGFCQCSLNGLVDVCTSDGFKGNGLVPCIHHWQVLDVLQSLNDDAYLYPTGLAIGKVIPAIWTFIDVVAGIWIVLLDHLPSPSPGEISKVSLLLRVVIAVDCVKSCENGLFHKQKCLRVEHIQQEPPSN